MCLGIPGQVTEMLDHEHLARVDVAGVGRIINIGLLEDEQIALGDWVLIHVGFAMSKIDEEEAEQAMAGLQMMGEAYTDEMTAMASSSVSDLSKVTDGSRVTVSSSVTTNTGGEAWQR